jgi:arylsulfatase A-like enzyme
VIVIITYDQAYGDLRVDGNPKIRAPNLDRLARQRVQLKQFYVRPVCSPARASLLPGRYNYRAGIVDAFMGRSPWTNRHSPGFLSGSDTVVNAPPARIDVAKDAEKPGALADFGA